ncbi:MAG: cytochrome c oxidase accessory protein CcoG [Caulobacteraceae bacterium]
MAVVIDTLNERVGTGAPAPAPLRPERKPAPKGSGLYKPREPIYPKLVHGRFRTLKWALMGVMLGIYYGVPWIRWPRPGAAPDQAIMIDFANGRFWLGPVHLWPQEVYFITGILVVAALGLFLSNALFGRLWCGYACPQTVWTDLYLYIERLFEGDRNARMRLAAAPWSFNKAWRKLGKHGVWLAVAGATGGAWIFYFQDAPTLWKAFWSAQAPMTAYISFWLLTFTTYWLAGFMREQVCTYMCPWPRIQGAMMDVHSLQVTYRYDRGEPRGAHKKNTSWEGRGDCIDCRACVVVCPMGIDIREGSQLECINCGLCIDACDEIMVKVDRPRGLIGYDTDAAVSGRACGKPAPYKLLRGRTVFYTVALAAVSALMLWGLLSRPTMEIHALRDRNPLFVRLQDGTVRNGYTLKVSNRTFETRTYAVKIEGLPGYGLRTPGDHSVQTVLPVTVDPDSVRAVKVFVTAPDADDAPIRKIGFVVQGGQKGGRAASTFITGAAK